MPTPTRTEWNELLATFDWDEFNQVQVEYLRCVYRRM